MKIRKLLLSLLALPLIAGLFSSNAHAAWDGKKTGKVGLIGQAANGGAYFTLEGLPALCTLSTDKSIGLLYSPPDTGDADRESVRTIIALLTSAKISGKEVTVFAKDHPDKWGCLVGFVQIE